MIEPADDYDDDGGWICSHCDEPRTRVVHLPHLPSSDVEWLCERCLWNCVANGELLVGTPKQVDELGTGTAPSDTNAIVITDDGTMVSDEGIQYDWG